MTDLLLEREGTGAEYPTIVIAAQRALYDTAGVKRGGGGGRGGRTPGIGHWSLQRGTLRYLLGPQEELPFNFDVLRTRPTPPETPHPPLPPPTPPAAIPL